MAGETVTLVAAATGGVALLGGVIVHESQRETAMRRGRRAYVVTFPAGASPEAALAGLASISGLDYRFEFVFEVVATADGIAHRLHLPEGAADAVIDILSSALPASAVTHSSRPRPGPRRPRCGSRSRRTRCCGIQSP